jgi:hypothetical protein
MGNKPGKGAGHVAAMASQSDDARLPEKGPAANPSSERLLVLLPNEGRPYT